MIAIFLTTGQVTRVEDIPPPELALKSIPVFSLIVELVITGSDSLQQIPAPLAALLYSIKQSPIYISEEFLQ